MKLIINIKHARAMPTAMRKGERVIFRQAAAVLGMPVGAGSQTSAVIVEGKQWLKPI